MVAIPPAARGPLGPTILKIVCFLAALVVLVLLAWLFNSWRNQRHERALARLNNPEGAAAERAAKKEKAEERAAKRPNGWIPRAARWVREVVWDGSPEKRKKAAAKAAAPPANSQQ